MKSRWTTYVLLAVVAVVWGVVVWKILRPAPGGELSAAAPAPKARPASGADADTLCCDYADPFLKDAARQPDDVPVVRALPVQVKSAEREAVRIEHLGTVASEGRASYLVELDGEPYELFRGDRAGAFVLAAADGDSIYFTKDGIRYGVKKCM